MTDEEEKSFVCGSEASHPIAGLSGEIYLQHVLYFIGAEDE